MSPPIAGKAGRCGHAHCSSCILHLISIAEEKPQCPICHCNIVLNDLKSIICGDEIRPKVNEQIQLVKMRRGKDSINPVKNVVGMETGSEYEWLDRHQRLVPVSTADFIKNIIDTEEVQLVIQRDECEDSEIPFVEQAQEMLRARRAHFHSLASKPCASGALSGPPDNNNSRTLSKSSDDFTAENPNLESSETDSTSDPELIAEEESKNEINGMYLHVP